MEKKVAEALGGCGGEGGEEAQEEKRRRGRRGKRGRRRGKWRRWWRRRRWRSDGGGGSGGVVFERRVMRDNASESDIAADLVLVLCGSLKRGEYGEEDKQIVDAEELLKEVRG